MLTDLEFRLFFLVQLFSIYTLTTETSTHILWGQQTSMMKDSIADAFSVNLERKLL